MVIVSREHWECDSLSPMFLFSQEVFDKNSVAVFGKKVDGVPYMNDIVESVSPSNGGGRDFVFPKKLTPFGGPVHMVDPWVHYRWGNYTIMNLRAPLDTVTWLCGFPFPCFCCLPGCCMPGMPWGFRDSPALSARAWSLAVSKEDGWS